jgi:hypothetical protein
MSLDFDPSLFPRAFISPRMYTLCLEGNDDIKPTYEALSDADYGMLCVGQLEAMGSLSDLLAFLPDTSKRIWIRKTKVANYLLPPHPLLPLAGQQFYGPGATSGRRSFHGQIGQYRSVLLVRSMAARERITRSVDLNPHLLLLGHDAWVLGYVHRWYGNIAAEALANLRAVWTLPLAMGCHRRLGKESVLGWLDSAVLGMIAWWIV